MVHRNIHDANLNIAKEHENGIAVLGLKFEVPDIVRQPGPPRGNVNPGRRNLGLQLLRDIIFDKLRKPDSKFTSDDLKRMVNRMGVIVGLTTQFFIWLFFRLF